MKTANDVPTVDAILADAGWQDCTPLELDNRFRRAYGAFLGGPDGSNPTWTALPSALSEAGYHLTKIDPVPSVKRDRDNHTAAGCMGEYFDAWWLLVLHLVMRASEITAFDLIGDTVPA